MVDGYDPLVNLPAGRILTSPQYQTLQNLADSLGRPLTASEIEEEIGAPLETPSLRRDFETGEHPRPGTFGSRKV